MVNDILSDLERIEKCDISKERTLLWWLQLREQVSHRVNIGHLNLNSKSSTSKENI